MANNTDNLCVPYYEPSSRITGRADGAKVTGKTFVKVAAAKDPGSRGLDPHDCEGARPRGRRSR